jgi:diadenosine tetraphosphate (Ap4A) HIT family hydrolase
MQTDPFTLDPRLASDSLPLGSWPLCELRLMNDRRFPWLLLIPRRAGLVEVTDLADSDYGRLATEIRAATRLVIDLESPDKTNVATLGNMVSQLHVHVIGRFHGDPAWPRPVWCAEGARPYRRGELPGLLARWAAAVATRAPV